ncbi:hypothetical protein HYZ41_04550 [archaeon]|nr:hypothetical protein [archaeon]
MTDYAEGKEGSRIVKIPLSVTNFGKPYRELFGKATAGGYEVWQISGLYRLDDYKNISRFIGRDFHHGGRGYGRFGVDASRHPVHSGSGWVGSRSADEEKIVLRFEI